uniref:HSF-type DNA-binding domain-containing protein n=2 Tax=Bos TaxID=9903 RepID=A0A4W2HHP4_BOBOX
MASQSSHEAQAAQLALSTDGEPAAGDSREVLEKQGEQPESQDRRLQDNLPPQGLNPKMAKEEDILGLSFPRKLWRIVEDAAFTSACWNDEENMVVIEEDLFRMEILQRRGMDQIFETDSIKSFISELNLYEFRKIHPLGCSAGKKMMMIYPNCNFQRDKPLLLQNIWRKGDPRTTAQPTASATATTKTKKLAVATRQSPRLHHNQCTQEAGKKVQKGMPPARRMPSWCSFVFSGLWSMGSVARWAGRNHLHSEQGGPSGEGTSSNATSVSPATSGKYPDYDLVMALHKICYYIPMVALSVMVPNEAPEAEEEQGESSDYKCVLCVHFKDKPNP